MLLPTCLPGKVAVLKGTMRPIRQLNGITLMNSCAIISCVSSALLFVQTPIGKLPGRAHATCLLKRCKAFVRKIVGDLLRSADRTAGSRRETADRRSTEICDTVVIAPRIPYDIAARTKIDTEHARNQPTTGC